MKNLSTTLYAPRLWPLLLIGVAALALGLRLLFSLEYSQIVVVWDAGLYWDRAQEVHSTLAGVPGAPALVDTLALLYNREGVLPLILGGLIGIFPEEPETVYRFNALLDALACVLVMLTARRLALPAWASVLAGVLLAVHIPAIIGAGAVLQQPLIRFALVLALWAYVRAFAAAKPGGWVVLGGLAVLLAGFGSVTTRPLIWLVFIAVLLMARKRPKIWWPQVAVIGLMAIGMAGLVLSMGGAAIGDTTMRVLTGLSASGGAQDQTTVLSFEHFWPPSSWQTVTDNPTQSLFSDFAAAPFAFAYKSAFSLYANYRYADTTYLQTFGLSVAGQTAQHLMLLVLGVLGVGWLLGHELRSGRGVAGVLMLVIGLYLSAAFSVISVEPRRLSVLTPFLALGAASAFYMLTRLRLSVAWLGVLVAVIGVWALPVGWLAALPLPVDVTYYALVAVRLAVTFVFVVLSTKAVETGYAAAGGSFSQGLYTWRMLLLPAFALLTVGLASVQNTSWREWSMDVTRIRQNVGNIGIAPGLQPWLVLDVAGAGQAALVTITVDGEVIKGPGTPMTQWTAGIPPEWSTYGTLDAIANSATTRRHWYAVPIPQAVFADGTLSIEVAAATPFTVYGDYLPLADDTYVGPLLSPWYDGNSFWRWQWNGTEPRIPAAQPLYGVAYTSAYLSGQTWHAVDDGLYRALVAMVPISPQTNAFGAPLAANVDAYCTDAGLRVLIAPENAQRFHACVDATDTVYFYAADTRIGAWSSVAGVTELADGQAVDVVQVLANTYVATISDATGPGYTLVFEVFSDA